MRFWKSIRKVLAASRSSYTKLTGKSAPEKATIDLTAIMSAEKDQWNKAAVDLARQYDNLTGDVLICSRLVAYLGAFTSAFREVSTYSERICHSTCGSSFFSTETFSTIACLLKVCEKVCDSLHCFHTLCHHIQLD